jgi:hypothetical protein
MIEWFLSLWDTRTAVAVVALIQPYVAWIWRRFIRPGFIDIHPTGNVEVGFSTFGPTIGMQGTLRSVHRDFFVSSISLDVTRLSDGAKHRFEWGAFRPNALVVGAHKDPQFEIPYGFFLSTTSPRLYNIFFFDAATQGEVREPVNALQRAWHDSLREARILPEQTEEKKAHYESSFASRSVHIDTFTTAGRLNYWQRGRYELKMRVQTTRPNREFDQTWRFTLTPTDSDLLHTNSVSIVRETCGQETQFGFAYPSYE